MTLHCQLLNVACDSKMESSWEVLVKNNPASGFMQSLSWARCKRMQGFDVVHLGVFEADELLGGMLCYIPPGSKSIGMATSPDGPVLNWDDEKQSVLAMSLMMDFLKRHAKEFSIMGLHAEPRLAPPNKKALRNFNRAPYDLLPAETLYLSVDQSEEHILEQMKPKGRYNIHLAERHGVQVRPENTAAGLDCFYDLLTEAGVRSQFFVEPYSFFASVYEALMPAKMLDILVARYEQAPVAAMMLVNFGLRCTYFYGGVANSHRQVMAGYALQWQAIKLAKSTGAKVYDFYGYTESGDPDHLYWSFSKFKRQFGGEAKTFIGAQHHLFVDRLADAVIAAAREIEMEDVYA